MGVAARRVAADRTLIPAVGAGLEGQRIDEGVELRYRCKGVGIKQKVQVPVMYVCMYVMLCKGPVSSVSLAVFSCNFVNILTNESFL